MVRETINEIQTGDKQVEHLLCMVPEGLIQIQGTGDARGQPTGPGGSKKKRDIKTK